MHLVKVDSVVSRFLSTSTRRKKNDKRQTETSRQCPQKHATIPGPCCRACEVVKRVDCCYINFE